MKPQTNLSLGMIQETGIENILQWPVCGGFSQNTAEIIRS